MKNLLRMRGRFCDNIKGAMSIEFVVLFPFVMLIIFFVVEIGILTGRTVMLKRGVSITINDVRLGLYDEQIENGNFRETFRQAVCDNALVISDCFNSLTVYMNAFDAIDVANNSAGVIQSVECRDYTDPNLNDNNSQNEFGTGQSYDVVIVTVCLMANPFYDDTPYGVPSLGAAFANSVFDGVVDGVDATADEADLRGRYAIVARSIFVNE